ncbi:MAG: AAA family ATPase, partial [Candidatus Taylorbacteria bacterium]|nr:AAA family ATPase [Candidatus Taylorbacteria bacterium]
MPEKVLIPDEFPVIIVDSKFMVLPSTGSFILPNEPAEEKLYADILEGKCPLIEGHQVCLVVMSNPNIDEEPDKFFNVGVVCEVKTIVNEHLKTIPAAGLFRLGITNLSRHDPEGYWTARGIVVEDEKDNDFFVEYNGKMVVRPAHRLWIRSMRQELRVLLADLIRMIEGLDNVNEAELIDVLDSIDNYDFYFRDSLNYFLWNILQVLPECTVFEKQEVLASQSLTDRLYMLLGFLSNNIDIFDGMHRIHAELTGEPYEDRELKNGGLETASRGKGVVAGEDETDDFMDGADPEVIEKYKKYLEIRDSVNELAQKTIMREFTRLKKLASVKEVSQEWLMAEDYIDTVLELPWNSRTPTEVNLVKVAETLDRDHYGLRPVKNKILRNLAAKQMNPKGKGPILCFVGPPGVGKTSVAQSIAGALERKFIRLSLGGIRDEAEIRGHRSTYIRALMGEIMEGLRKVGTKNPVFVLDEVDKIGEDFRGNPASALLEVLDPEQNYSFKDHYLGFPFDLSEVLFICTANVTATIKPALLNRMNVIELDGYTEEEKLQIAKRYLLKKAQVHAGFDEHGIEVLCPNNDLEGLLAEIISGYTRESGVRELER